MTKKKNILVIIGSASEDSANEKLVNNLAALTQDALQLTVFNALKTLPHFDPGQSVNHPPEPVLAFRKAVEQAHGVLICTPEYVFSIPSGLKNAVEWCVATTVFSGKPTGLITASAQGQKGHEELQLIMKTLMAELTNDTTLLIQGIKGKINEAGEITDAGTKLAMEKFSNAFMRLIRRED